VLCLGNVGRLAPDLQPLVDPREVTIGIVHLGVGAFHRAHQAVYTEAAMQLSGQLRWGIYAASERAPDAAGTLSAQDCLYSVLVAGPQLRSLRVAGALRKAVFARAEPDALTRAIADPAVKVVTLTVSEKGYRHNPATRRLREDDAELDADASGRPPVTVLGQLARGLQARRRSDAGPLSVISCDNMPANGQLLQCLLSELVNRPAARYDAGLEGWAMENVRFPSTMVDRIVPATTDQWREEVSQRLGLVDRAPVVTEPFSQWVVQDDFAAARPAWERAGAEVVPDVAPFEALKLRALNGSHSALAYLGLLAGDVTIAEALSRPNFEVFVRKMLSDEVEPTLVLPPGADFGAYAGSVLARFANVSLPYRCEQVAGDGSQKLPQRILGTVRDRLRSSSPFPHLALVVAAWLRAIWLGADDHGRPFGLSDPLAGQLRASIGPSAGPAQVVEEALGTGEVFGEDLAGDDRFRASLQEAFMALARAGAVGAAGSVG